MNTILWTLLTALCFPFLSVAARLRGHPQTRKILIIQWAKLGDLVCTTPMFRAIKAAHPDWTVHVLCRARCGGVLRGNPFIDCVIAHGGTRGELVTMLRHEQYDVVINAVPDAFSALLGILCSVRMRINTFSTARGLLVRWTRIFNTVNIVYRIGTSTFDHYLSLLQPIGIPAIPYRLDFFPSPEDEVAARRWMDAAGRRYAARSFIIFNVSAGNAVKEWPADKFTQLADTVIDRHGLFVVLSSLDRERIDCIRSSAKHPEKILDASVLTLGQCGALCARAAAFVAVDTGPMYVAYACGAPIAVLIGGCDPREQIPPEGERVVHVMPPPGCEPWMHVSLSPRTATEEQFNCIRGTAVEDVTEAVQRLLKK